MYDAGSTKTLLAKFRLFSMIKIVKAEKKQKGIGLRMFFSKFPKQSLFDKVMQTRDRLDSESHTSHAVSVIN